MNRIFYNTLIFINLVSILYSETIVYSKNEQDNCSSFHPRNGKGVHVLQIESLDGHVAFDEETGKANGIVSLIYLIAHPRGKCRILETIELQGRQNNQLHSIVEGTYRAKGRQEIVQGDLRGCEDLLPQQEGAWEGVFGRGQNEEDLSLFYMWKKTEKGSLGRFKREKPRPISANIIVRTLVYDQITDFPKDVNLNSNPVLSRDGELIVFSLRGPPTKIYQMNFDGSGLKKVEEYQRHLKPMLALSPDGRYRITSDGFSLRSNGNPLLAFAHSNIVAIAPAKDRIYFLLRIDTPFGNKLMKHRRGLYSINYNGADFQLHANAKDIARALHIETRDGNEIYEFGENSASLATSDDGTAAIFAVKSKGWGKLSSGKWLFLAKHGEITPLLGPCKTISSVGISDDGALAGYTVIPLSGPIEGGVIRTDSTKKMSLVANPPLPFVDGNTRNEPIQFSTKGEKILFGTSAYLFQVNGKEMLQLGTGGGRRAKFSEELYRLRMNREGDRFIFLMRGARGQRQLASLLVNPKEIAEAPKISHPSITPPHLLIGETSFATVCAHVSCKNLVTTVANQVFYKGIADHSIHCGMVMYDDGRHRGDRGKNDGVYTHNGINAHKKAQPGSRTIRVKAESRSDDNRYHATAIEFKGLTVQPQSL